MDKIFFDANFLVGIYYSIDNLHHRSREMGKNLKKQQYERVVSNYIIDEVLTVLRRRAPNTLVEEITKTLFDLSAMHVIQINQVHDEFAKDLFLKHAQEKLSFTDASILALMHYEHISRLVTFDQNLGKVAKKYGFTVLGCD